MSEKTQGHARKHERYGGGFSPGKCIVILNKGIGFFGKKKGVYGSPSSTLKTILLL